MPVTAWFWASPSTSSSLPESFLPPSSQFPPPIDAEHKTRRTPEEQSARRRKQITVFGAGLFFTLVSARITKRALTRKQFAVSLMNDGSTMSQLSDAALYVQQAQIRSRAARHLLDKSKIVKGSHPLNLTPTPPPMNTGIDAFEALTLATLNVFSVTFMAVGTSMWYWDICTTSDLREKLRRGIGIDEDGIAGEKRAEEEFEEWLATTLDRRDRKAEADDQRARVA